MPGQTNARERENIKWKKWMNKEMEQSKEWKNNWPAIYEQKQNKKEKTVPELLGKNLRDLK